MYPSCLNTAYRALAAGRHVIGIVNRPDHLSVLSWTRTQLSEDERAAIYHPNPAVRSDYLVKALVAMDREMRDKADSE
jgi:hypothetical protein